MCCKCVFAIDQSVGATLEPIFPTESLSFGCGDAKTGSRTEPVLEQAQRVCLSGAHRAGVGDEREKRREVWPGGAVRAALLGFWPDLGPAARTTSGSVYHVTQHHLSDSIRDLLPLS